MFTLLNAPSLELQTVEFYEHACTAELHDNVALQRYGFRVLLEYVPAIVLSTHGVLSDILVIGDVYVPVRYRGRGWLTYYLKLCSSLVGDALMIADPYGPWGDILRLKGFIPVAEIPGFLMLKK